MKDWMSGALCFSFHSLYIVHFRLIVYLSILGFNVIAGDLAQSILLTFDEYTILFLNIYFQQVHVIDLHCVYTLKEQLCVIGMHIWYLVYITDFLFFDPVLCSFIWVLTSASYMCRRQIVLMELLFGEPRHRTVVLVEVFMFCRVWMFLFKKNK